MSQFARRERHAEVARAMLEAGTAYRCYASQDEIEAAREAARAEGRSTLYRSPWRDSQAPEAPERPCVIRLKAPREGTTVIGDAVQGEGDPSATTSSTTWCSCARTAPPPTCLRWWWTITTWA